MRARSIRYRSAMTSAAPPERTTTVERRSAAPTGPTNRVDPQKDGSPMLR